MKYSSLLICIGLIVCSTSAIGEESTTEAKVKETLERFYDAVNAGDAKAVYDFYLPGGNTFPRSGMLLSGYGTVDDLQTLYDRGLKYEVFLHHLEVKVYGQTAVATFYTTGPMTQPGGAVLNGSFRGTGVWVQKDGEWKAAHFHLSRLEAGTSP